MKFLLLLPLLVLLIGCAETATKLALQPHVMTTASTNWIPSGLWTDTDGRMFFLYRCDCVSNVLTCKGEWVMAKPAPPSGTFTNGIPDPMLKQFYPPIPLPTRPQPPRDPLNHP